MHTSKVCGQHSFGLPPRMKFTESNLIIRIWIFSCHSESDHACLEHLSSETCAKHSFGVKAFHPFTVSPLLRNFGVFLLSIIF